MNVRKIGIALLVVIGLGAAFFAGTRFDGLRNVAMMERMRGQAWSAQGPLANPQPTLGPQGPNATPQPNLGPQGPNENQQPGWDRRGQSRMHDRMHDRMGPAGSQHMGGAGSRGAGFFRVFGLLGAIGTVALLIVAVLQYLGRRRGIGPWANRQQPASPTPPTSTPAAPSSTGSSNPEEPPYTGHTRTL